MYEYIHTHVDVIFAIIAACVGCSVRYAEIYKRDSKKLKVSYFLVDLAIAAFMGFVVFKFAVGEKLCTPNQVVLLNCLMGFIGSRVFDIASYLMYTRLGINVKFDSDDVRDTFTSSIKPEKPAGNKEPENK